MHDLKNLCERHIRGSGNIVDFYATQSSEHQPRRLNEDLGVSGGLSVFEIDTLPPEMMKVTQSVKKIFSYQKAPPVLNLPIPQFTRFSFDGKTYDTLQDLEALNRSVTEITRTTPDGGAVNLYIEQKRFSDIVYLISRFSAHL